MKIILYGPVIMRIALGSTFLLHGCQKVFGLFGGSGVAQFAQGLVTKGVPLWLSYMAAWFEFLAGLSILMGFFTEIGAAMAICVMAGAIVLVHGSHGYFLQSHGFEYAFNLLLFCVALICTGPGTWFLWDPFYQWR